MLRDTASDSGIRSHRNRQRHESSATRNCQGSWSLFWLQQLLTKTRSEMRVYMSRKSWKIPQVAALAKRPRYKIALSRAYNMVMDYSGPGQGIFIIARPFLLQLRAHHWLRLAFVRRTCRKICFCFLANSVHI